MNTATEVHGAGADAEADEEELWLPPLSAARRRRGPTSGRSPRAPLSRTQIVQAAIAIADREGAEAVGMRRIARELGAGNMSIYWHVASKDELLALMIDAVEGEFEIAEPSGNWRADLSQSAHDIRAVLTEIFDVVQSVTLGRSISFLYGMSTPTEHTDEIWPPEMRARLAGIKAEWDPQNLFRAGPSVA